MNRTEVMDYISCAYAAEADFPFMQYPDVAVFRHANNRKWFAAIMNVEKNKLGIKDSGTIDIINLKCDPILAGSIRSEKGFYPGYHMNKSNWISAALDGSAESEKIKWLIDISFELTAKKIKKKSEGNN